MLYADMSPEIEYFLADRVLEPIGKGECEQHGGYADHRRRDRQPYDKPGKGPLPVKSDASGYKGCYIQSAWFGPGRTFGPPEGLLLNGQK